jgi:thiol-disulfide isomerase/thioredoxin
VLVNFWGTGCVPCLKELPGLESLAERFGGRGLVVWCVCADEQDPQTAAGVAGRHVRRLPVYVSPDATAKVWFDVQVLPTTFLIDPHGRLVGRVEGGRDWSGADMTDLLKAYLAPVPTGGRTAP